MNPSFIYKSLTTKKFSCRNGISSNPSKSKKSWQAYNMYILKVKAAITQITYSIFRSVAVGLHEAVLRVVLYMAVANCIIHINLLEDIHRHRHRYRYRHRHRHRHRQLVQYPQCHNHPPVHEERVQYWCLLIQQTMDKHRVP